MTPTQKDAEALAAIDARCCGRSVTLGHSEGAKCGGQFYGIKFRCDTCWSDSAANVRAYLIERLASAEAELAAVRGDAERYRWLRDKALYAEPDSEGLMVWCVRGKGNGHQYPEDGKELTAAIDTARGGRGNER